MCHVRSTAVKKVLLWQKTCSTACWRTSRRTRGLSFVCLSILGDGRLWVGSRIDHLLSTWDLNPESTTPTTQRAVKELPTRNLVEISALNMSRTDISMLRIDVSMLRTDTCWCRAQTCIRHFDVTNRRSDVTNRHIFVPSNSESIFSSGRQPAAQPAGEPRGGRAAYLRILKYTQVYSVIYDPGSVLERSIFSPRGTSTLRLPPPPHSGPRRKFRLEIWLKCRLITYLCS